MAVFGNAALIYIPRPEAVFLLIIPNAALGQGLKLRFYSQTQLQILIKLCFSNMASVVNGSIAAFLKCGYSPSHINAVGTL